MPGSGVASGGASSGRQRCPLFRRPRRWQQPVFAYARRTQQGSQQIPERQQVKGKFITFEGIDGAGKSSHVEWLATFLRDKGRVVHVTREPGGTELGEKLRELLLHKSMHLETETLLMFAARREHLAKVIEPALAQRRVGGLRPLQRCDLRLSGRRARSRPRQAPATRTLGTWTSAARSDPVVRSAAGCRTRAHRRWPAGSSTASSRNVPISMSGFARPTWNVRIPHPQGFAWSMPSKASKQFVIYLR